MAATTPLLHDNALSALRNLGRRVSNAVAAPFHDDQGTYHKEGLEHLGLIVDRSLSPLRALEGLTAEQAQFVAKLEQIRELLARVNDPRTRVDEGQIRTLQDLLIEEREGRARLYASLKPVREGTAAGSEAERVLAGKLTPTSVAEKFTNYTNLKGPPPKKKAAFQDLMRQYVNPKVAPSLMDFVGGAFGGEYYAFAKQFVDVNKMAGRGLGLLGKGIKKTGVGAAHLLGLGGRGSLADRYRGIKKATEVASSTDIEDASMSPVPPMGASRGIVEQLDAAKGGESQGTGSVAHLDGTIREEGTKTRATITQTWDKHGRSITDTLTRTSNKLGQNLAQTEDARGISEGGRHRSLLAVLKGLMLGGGTKADGSRRGGLLGDLGSLLNMIPGVRSLLATTAATWGATAAIGSAVIGATVYGGRKLLRGTKWAINKALDRKGAPGIEVPHAKGGKIPHLKGMKTAAEVMNDEAKAALHKPGFVRRALESASKWAVRHPTSLIGGVAAGLGAAYLAAHSDSAEAAEPTVGSVINPEEERFSDQAGYAGWDAAAHTVGALAATKLATKAHKAIPFIAGMAERHTAFLAKNVGRLETLKNLIHNPKALLEMGEGGAKLGGKRLLGSIPLFGMLTDTAFYGGIDAWKEARAGRYGNALRFLGKGATAAVGGAVGDFAGGMAGTLAGPVGTVAGAVGGETIGSWKASQLGDKWFKPVDYSKPAGRQIDEAHAPTTPTGVMTPDQAKSLVAKEKSQIDEARKAPDEGGSRNLMDVIAKETGYDKFEKTFIRDVLHLKEPDPDASLETRAVKAAAEPQAPSSTVANIFGPSSSSAGSGMPWNIDDSGLMLLNLAGV